MRYVVCAWIGPPIGGHGSAVCVECGWTKSSPRLYGEVALAALRHERLESESVLRA